MHEVTVVGAGIVGCSAAAFLAEAGVGVRVLDREGVAAGASGRNSGVLQHPLDPVLEPLYRESLRHHADVLGELGAPSGALLLGAREESADEIGARFPDLRPEWLPDARAAEPGLAPLAAVRLESGHPVGPAAATEGFARRAREAGARFETLAVERAGGGARTGSGLAAAGTPLTGPLLVAAGAWTSELLPEIPIRPLWGVVADLALDAPPHHALEEAGVEALLHPDGPPPRLFSLVRTALGSTFSAGRPDPGALVADLQERAQRFFPAAATAPVRSTRACPRPASPDGLPTIGHVAPDVVVAAGHGPWGLTLGPASARLAADVLLGDAEPPHELAPARWLSG